MKQLSYGVMMYVSDYEGVYMGYAQETFSGETTPLSTKIWSWMIQPYTKSKEIFACPSAGRFRESYGDTWVTRGQQSIGLNIHMGKWRQEDFPMTSNGSPLRLTESFMQYPYKNIILADSVNGDTNYGYKGYIVSNWDYYSRCGGPVPVNAIGRSFSDRHTKNTNVAFADGHVKSTKSALLLPNLLVSGDCRCISDMNPLRLKWAVTLNCPTDNN